MKTPQSATARILAAAEPIVPNQRSVNMRVQLRPISEIHPYENNPRLNDAAVEAAARETVEALCRRFPLYGIDR